MKNLLALLIIGVALLISSCSKDNDILVEDNYTIDNYVGIWESTVNCTGPMSADNSEVIVITITKGALVNELNIDFGDDTVFSAFFENADLTLETQILNAGQGFDEISMSATGLLEEENKLSLSLTHSVDNEGVSQCDLEFTK